MYYNKTKMYSSGIFFTFTVPMETEYKFLVNRFEIEKVSFLGQIGGFYIYIYTPQNN